MREKAGISTSKFSRLKLVIAGHVDHGKSTLIGRLLYESGSLQAGKFEAIQASCARRGVPFEWSFLMDALQSERDQNVTIDTTQIGLKLPGRYVTIIDVPGHKEFLKNMLTGASQADAALLLIDAAEGISEQSHLHAALLQMLGINQVIIVINKMDKIGYSEAHFQRIATNFTEYLQALGMTPVGFIPISARDGDNIASLSARMAWYKGQTLLSAIEALKPASLNEELPLRFPIQDVYKWNDRRILVGRIFSGKLHVGDCLQFSPSGATATVASIETWPLEEKMHALCGESIGITLDAPIFVERGHLASHAEDPPILTQQCSARIFWLSATPLLLHKRYTMLLGTVEIAVHVKEISHIIDTQHVKTHLAEKVERHQLAEIVIKFRSPAAMDAFSVNPATGRFVLKEGAHIVGGGTINAVGFTDQRSHKTIKSQNIFDVDSGITLKERALMNGHFGGILWFTGLSGSGKSTIAMALQKRLFAKGYHAFVLDGDNIRKGLASDLGFSPSDRAENIRRIGEVAALFAAAGTIVITAFISPYREDRARARASAPEQFHELYIKASLDTCEQRDAKGLYKQARSGKIPEFTGISAPYEAPEDADMVIDTETQAIDACIDQLINYVEQHFVVPVKTMSMENE